MLAATLGGDELLMSVMQASPSRVSQYNHPGFAAHDSQVSVSCPVSGITFDFPSMPVLVIPIFDLGLAEQPTWFLLSYFDNF